jgi:arylformamidase
MTKGPADTSEAPAHRLIDISPTLSARVAVWPGDTGFSRTENLSIAGGDNIDLSEIRTTVHVGAHTDAPSHYDPGGQTIEARPLNRYYGDCLVLTVSVAPGARIQPTDLPDAVRAATTLPGRVLLHTASYGNPDEFTTDFASLSPELVDFLADRQVSLVGIDTPSVDPYDDAELHSHTAIARRDLAILEGIVLTGVDDGRYILIALPLKLEGADASPVRAALVAARGTPHLPALR